MATPAIEAILTKLVTVIEGLTPSIEAAKTFKRSTERAQIETFPTTAPKRRFDVDFEGLRDLSATATGFSQTPQTAHREATFRVGIFYPTTQAEKNVEKQIASDCEVIMRAISDATKWTGTNYRRAVVTNASTDRSSREGEAIILNLQVEILYLDVEA